LKVKKKMHRAQAPGMRLDHLGRVRINKTMSSRIVLVVRGLIFTARARMKQRGLVCAVAMTLVMAGCGRHSSVRLPGPPAPARIGSTETGIASWYGVPYHGRRSASGEIFDMETLTAAHRKLPFQTWVEVTNLSNGKQVDVRITDRGPFVRGRIIDLSMAAARDLDMVRAGTARVRLKVIAPPADLPRAKALENPPDEPQTRNRTYAVQAGAFSYRLRAEAFRDSLSYPDARVIGLQPNFSLWRVLVGHALTFQEASALAAQIAITTGEALVIDETTVEEADKR
jgi:peptidoglycan lytic transglycosylase